MRYGEKLREFRVARGWSRERLARNTGYEVSTPAIEAIEMGRSVFPHDTTRSLLGRALPELAVWEHEFKPTYAKELREYIFVIG